MATRKSLVWNGKAVTDRMRAAQIEGVNRTMASCVRGAKDNHAWKNRTGILEGSIGVAENAAVKGAGVEGTWGSKDVKYASIHEQGGTIQHPGGTSYFIGDDGKAVFVSSDDPRAAGLPKTKPHPIPIPARPYLRPAADVHYPDLAGNIRKAFNRSGRKGARGG
jgi:phage gpG-like protein